MHPALQVLCDAVRALHKQATVDAVHWDAVEAAADALRVSHDVSNEHFLVEDPVNPQTLTAKQRDVYDNYIDRASDMVNHLPSYTDEECAIVARVIYALRQLPDVPGEDVHDDERVLEAIKEVFTEETYSEDSFSESFVAMQRKTSCAWDPRGRDTQLQFHFRLSTPLPLRLVMLPRSEQTLAVIRPVVRHVSKPFQSLHLTTDMRGQELLEQYKSTCQEFVMSVWVGKPGSKVTDTGTGFRTNTFIGGGASPDYALRILFQRGLTGEALRSALQDFVELFEDPQRRIPVLMPMRVFTDLSAQTN